MATETLSERAPEPTPRALDRWVGHPIAYLMTAAVLLTIFGWTFLVNPHRLVPSNDPAYYTWRTEALLTETPETLVEIEGPRFGGGAGIYSGGYRLTAAVFGGMMRRVASVASLSATALLMAATPVLTVLALGAFAFQYRRDPLIFHAVAFGAASLYLTPPFLGYLDNLLALLFVAAALLFLRDTPKSWAARSAFGLLLVTVGVTHPTTLVIFTVTLGAMAVVRLVARGFRLRSVVRDDGPILLTTIAAIVVTYVLWKLGIWGPSVSPGATAPLPPYEATFFFDRLVRWIDAMRPAFNGPLLLLGAVSLLVAGRRAAEDELSRVAIVWLAPLAGVFGFAIGASYSYYRFFNATLAWVLLVGIGMWVAARFFTSAARRGGIYNFAWIGVLAVALVIGTNFRSSLDTSGRGAVAGGWLPIDQQVKLDDLRAALAQEGDPRPVVFVVDSDETVRRIYGHTKLSGNIARYGLPTGWIDEGYVYLGSVENLLAGEPTSTGDDTYDEMSLATLEDIEANAPEGAGRVVVVAAPFNRTGSNTDFVRSPDPIATPAGTEVWVVNNDGVSVVSGTGRARSLEAADAVESRASGWHIVRVVLGLLLLLLPGSLATRWLLRDATFPEWLAAAPALGVSIVTLMTTVVLAVSRNPLGRGEAWAALALSITLTGALAWHSRRRHDEPV